MASTLFMNEEEAKIYLENTKTSMMLKLITSGVCAATLMVVILLQQLPFWNPEFNGLVENIYFATGIAALLLGGGAKRTLRMASTAFKWGYNLTPLYIFDLIIGACFGIVVLAAGLIFPFVPTGMELLSLNAKRQTAKLHVKK